MTIPELRSLWHSEYHGEPTTQDLIDFQRRRLSHSASRPVSACRTVENMQKHYGDTAVLDAVADTGSIEGAYRLLRREQQRAKRAHRAKQRRNARANQILFRSAVIVDESLVSALANGRDVHTQYNRRMIRATMQRVVRLAGVEYGHSHNNTILLWDLRAGVPLAGAVVSVEMIWTGSDYRLHFWRRSATDPREPVALAIGQSTAEPIMPPLRPLEDLGIRRIPLEALDE